MILALLLITVWAYRSLGTADFAWEDTDPVAARFALQPRALTALTMRLQTEQPASYVHAVNLSVHLVNGLLLYAVVPSLLAVTLWWLLPIQSEAVAYVAGRSELLVCTAVLLLLLASRVRGVAGWLGMGLCLVLAVLAKETGAMAGGLLLVWRWANRRPVAGALCVASLGVLGLTASMILPRLSSWVAPGLRPQPWFAGVQVAAMWRYLWLTVWPFQGQLSIVHDFDLVGPRVAACAVSGLAGAVWIAFRSQVRPLLLAVLWPIVALAPRLIVPLPDAMSERHWMIAVLGFCLAIGLFQQERVYV